MRYLVVLSTILAVYGVGLVYGSLLTVPYTVTEEVRVDLSKTWVDDTFVLMPFRNMTHILDSISHNASIFQVDVDSSDFVVFTIISDTTGEVWFERGPGKGDWTSYWTPPALGYGSWRFVFVNPSSVSVNVTAKVTEFYVEATEYRDFTYYRPFLDPIYGYSGIIAIIVGTALNIVGELLPRAHSTSSTEKPH